MKLADLPTEWGDWVKDLVVLFTLIGVLVAITSFTWSSGYDRGFEVGRHAPQCTCEDPLVIGEYPWCPVHSKYKDAEAAHAAAIAETAEVL